MNLKSSIDETVAQAVGVSKTVQMASETIHILQDISLTISAGKTVAISGASGSGKTTLLGLLAGLDQPTSGSLALLGQDLSGLDEDQRAELRCGTIGFVFQSFHLLPNLTAIENVSLALEVIPNSKNIESRSQEALSLVGLSKRSTHLPSQMSGGEQQRVALARSIVIEPVILFADEPTGNLDHRTSTQISDLIFELCNEKSSTLVMVTHNRNLAERCDRHHHLEAGRLM